MERYIIIHYGEIYLKGDNRRYFEDRLIGNIKKALKDYGNITLKHVAGRIIVLVEEKWDLADLKAKLKKVFGIEYLALAWNCEQDYKAIEKSVYSLLKDKDFKTFRITARRGDKSFSLNSQEIDVKLGAFVQMKMKKKVDLEKFDLNIYLDIFREYALIYFDKIQCRGGLPVGVSGNLICLISGGIDSPVAANLMQKRGSGIIYVNFDSYPATPKENQQKVKDLVKVLNEYQSESKLYIVPFLDIQKEIINIAPQNYRVIFYRRMMMRLACEIAKRENVLALVTGDSLGQVASQTVENIRAISESIDLPILRPLIGLNKEEITQIAKQIGTYEISAQQFQDCCSLYVPKHPITKSDLNLILETEKNWEFAKMLEETIAKSEIISIT